MQLDELLNQMRIELSPYDWGNECLHYYRAVLENQKDNLEKGKFNFAQAVNNSKNKKDSETNVVRMHFAVANELTKSNQDEKGDLLINFGYYSLEMLNKILKNYKSKTERYLRVLEEIKEQKKIIFELETKIDRLFKIYETLRWWQLYKKGTLHNKICASILHLNEFKIELSGLVKEVNSHA
jgi:hypothetical protein